MTPSPLPPFVFGRDVLTPRRLHAVASGACTVALWDDPAYHARLSRAHDLVLAALAAGEPVYGVTTGFGASCENRVDPAYARALAENLVRYHGCGVGAPFPPLEAAAIVASRIQALAQGKSGVRVATLARLTDLLGARLLPVIPSEGSVGASGDLTPLSYVASMLLGEGEVYGPTGREPAAAALARVGLAPLSLEPKESLALMNGTSAMTGLAALGWVRAARFARIACAGTAWMVEVLHGRAEHFDARLAAAKAHPGQVQAAELIRADLAVGPHPPRGGARVQDRYSLRCAPQVIGVLLDALRLFAPVLEAELNGVSDNPLVDIDGDAILHGGNFYGGHVTFVLDGLKAAVASVAELLERQLVQLLHSATSQGLPDNLVAVEGAERAAHHGFKAMEITASALVAEALKLTMPAGAFSRSTEGHNQDKVPMGPIAARELLRVLDLAETVSAIHLLACAQAADLRGAASLRGRAAELYANIRRQVPPVTRDRRQDGDIQWMLAAIRGDGLGLPDDGGQP